MQEVLLRLKSKPSHSPAQNRSLGCSLNSSAHCSGPSWSAPTFLHQHWSFPRHAMLLTPHAAFFIWNGLCLSWLTSSGTISTIRPFPSVPVALGCVVSWDLSYYIVFASLSVLSSTPDSELWQHLALSKSWLRGWKLEYWVCGRWRTNGLNLFLKDSSLEDPVFFTLSYDTQLFKKSGKWVSLVKGLAYAICLKKLMGENRQFG